jgi:hypothetical protein
MQTNNMVWQPMISNGNGARVLGGFASNLLTGSSRHVMGSKKVFLCVKLTTTGMVVRVDQDSRVERRLRKFFKFLAHVKSIELRKVH